MPTFWTRAESFPPILVRILAKRQHGPPLTDDEIASTAGLPVGTVHTISWLTSWDGIDLPTMRRFLVGCRCDFEDAGQMERIRSYLKARPNWKYLRSSSQWHKLYEPMIRKWRQHYERSTRTTKN